MLDSKCALCHLLFGNSLGCQGCEFTIEATQQPRTTSLWTILVLVTVGPDTHTTVWCRLLPKWKDGSRTWTSDACSTRSSLPALFFLRDGRERNPNLFPASAWRPRFAAGLHNTSLSLSPGDPVSPRALPFSPSSLPDLPRQWDTPELPWADRPPPRPDHPPTTTVTTPESVHGARTHSQLPPRTTWTSSKETARSGVRTTFPGPYSPRSVHAPRQRPHLRPSTTTNRHTKPSPTPPVPHINSVTEGRALQDGLTISTISYRAEVLSCPSLDSAEHT